VHAAILVISPRPPSLAFSLWLGGGTSVCGLFTMQYFLIRAISAIGEDVQLEQQNERWMPTETTTNRMRTPRFVLSTEIVVSGKQPIFGCGLLYLSSAVSWHYYLNLQQGRLFSSFRPLFGLRSALPLKQRLADNSVDLPLAVFGRAELILWKRECRVCRKYKYNKRRNKGVSVSVINGWVVLCTSNQRNTHTISHSLVSS